MPTHPETNDSLENEKIKRPSFVCLGFGHVFVYHHHNKHNLQKTKILLCELEHNVVHPRTQNNKWQQAVCILLRLSHLFSCLLYAFNVARKRQGELQEEANSESCKMRGWKRKGYRKEREKSEKKLEGRGQ